MNPNRKHELNSMLCPPLHAELRERMPPLPTRHELQQFEKLSQASGTRAIWCFLFGVVLAAALLAAMVFGLVSQGIAFWDALGGGLLFTLALTVVLGPKFVRGASVDGFYDPSWYRPMTFIDPSDLPAYTIEHNVAGKRLIEEILEQNRNPSRAELRLVNHVAPLDKKAIERICEIEGTPTE